MSIYVHVEGVLNKVLETRLPTGGVRKDLRELLKLSEKLVRRDVWEKDEDGRILSRVMRYTALSKIMDHSRLLVRWLRS
jgi:hypothetical protein